MKWRHFDVPQTCFLTPELSIPLLWGHFDISQTCYSTKYCMIVCSYVCAGLAMITDSNNLYTLLAVSVCHVHVRICVVEMWCYNTLHLLALVFCRKDFLLNSGYCFYWYAIFWLDFLHGWYANTIFCYHERVGIFVELEEIIKPWLDLSYFSTQCHRCIFVYRMGAASSVWYLCIGNHVLWLVRSSGLQGIEVGLH